MEQVGFIDLFFEECSIFIFDESIYLKRKKQKQNKSRVHKCISTNIKTFRTMCFIIYVPITNWYKNR